MCVNFFCGIPILSGLKSDNLNYAIVILWWIINFVAPGKFILILNDPVCLTIPPTTRSKINGIYTIL